VLNANSAIENPWLSQGYTTFSSNIISPEAHFFSFPFLFLVFSLRNSGLPAYAPDGNANFAAENPLFSQEYTTFQAFNDIPTIVAPSYNTDAQRYTGDARYITELCDANPPSCPRYLSLFTAFHLRLILFLFFAFIVHAALIVIAVYMSASLLKCQVVFQEDTLRLETLCHRYRIQHFRHPATHILPCHRTEAIQLLKATKMILGTSHNGILQNHLILPPHSNFDNLGHFSFDHSAYSLTPQYPSSSVSSTPVSMSETPHPNTHHPTPPVGHNYQAVVPSEQGGQQPGTPRIFNIDGCCIDGYDLADQGAVNGRIIVGRCFRTDSPCGLWVKADKRSIKRHAQRWHGISRGGEGSRASCTWAGCNTVLQKSAIPRHTLRQHYGERFKCEGCSRCFTRLYCWKNHAKKCASSSEGCTVRYDDGTHTINVTMYFSDDGS
jgi:hypothetical protein